MEAIHAQRTLSRQPLHSPQFTQRGLRRICLSVTSNSPLAVVVVMRSAAYRGSEKIAVDVYIDKKWENHNA